MRWRRILSITAILLTVLAVTVIVVLETYDFNRFKPLITGFVEKSTGRRLAIDGDIDIDWGIHPGMSFQGIRLQNAAWSSTAEMLTVERIDVHLSLLSLVFGPVEIHDVILRNPLLLIETGPGGKSNLALDTPGQPSGGDGGSPNLRIEYLLIESGRLTYRKDQTGKGKVVELALDRFEAKITEDSSSAGIDIDGRINRHPVRVTGRLKRPLAVVSTGEPLDIALKLEGLQTVVQIEGEIRKPREIAGVTISLKAVGQATGDIFELIDAGDIPELGPYQLTAELDGDLTGIRIDQLELSLGQPQMATFQVSGKVADLSNFAEMDLQVSVEGEELNRLSKIMSQSVPYSGPYRLAGRVADSGRRQYRVTDFSMAIAQSDLKASADIDVSDTRPKIDLKAESRHIDLRPLFEASADQNNGGPDTHPETAEKQPTISDLFSLADIDLELKTGRIVLPNLILEDLKTAASLAGGRLSLNIDGSRVPDLESLTTLTRMSELGPFQASGLIKPVEDRLTLADLRFKAGRPATAEVTASGRIGNLLTGREFKLEFRIRGDDAAKLARYIVEPWPLKGQYALTGRMTIADYAELRFAPLKGTLAEMPFDGSVIVDLSRPAPSVRIDAASPHLNLKALALPGVSLPESLRSASDLGPLEAHLDIVVPEGPVGFDAVRIIAGRSNLLALQVTGRVTDIVKFRGIELKLLARGDDLSRLETFFDTAIPFAQTFELRGDVKTSEPGRYHFSNVSATLGSNTLSADIQLETDHRRPKLRASLDADTIDLSPLLVRTADRQNDTSYFKKTLLEERLILPSWPKPPAMVTDTDIDLRLDARQVIGEGFEIGRLKGQLRQSAGGIAVEADAFLMADVRQNAEPVEWLDIGRVDLKLGASMGKERLAVDTFHLQAGDPQTIMLNLEGHAADIVRQHGLDVKFVLKGKDAAHLNRFVSTPKPLSGPFVLQGHMSDPGLKNYRIDDLQLSISGCDLAGNIDIDLAAERPRFEADLTSQQIDLRPFVGEEKPAPPPEQRSSAGSAKVFSSDPIYLEWRHLLDMRLSLKSRQLILPFAAVEHLTVDATLNNGDLAVDPVSFATGQASFKGQLKLTGESDQPRTALVMKVAEYDIGKELGDMGLARDITGRLNADIDLNGRGVSIAAIMAALNGKIILSLNDGRINDRFIGLIYADLTSTLLKLLHPFSKGDNYVELNCLVGTFVVEDGHTNSAVVLDTPETTLYSAGKIDLKTEKLDVTLKSDPKKGLGLRIKGLGRIGFSLNELARPFKLGGTLARPNLAVDPSQTAFTFSKIIGGLALGPYGIALLFTDVSLAEQNPCVKELLKADQKTPDRPSKK